MSRTRPRGDVNRSGARHGRSHVVQHAFVQLRRVRRTVFRVHGSMALTSEQHLHIALELTGNARWRGRRKRSGGRHDDATKHAPACFLRVFRACVCACVCAVCVPCVCAVCVPCVYFVIHSYTEILHGTGYSPALFGRAGRGPRAGPVEVSVSSRDARMEGACLLCTGMGSITWLDRGVPLLAAALVPK